MNALHCLILKVLDQCRLLVVGGNKGTFIKHIAGPSAHAAVLLQPLGKG